MQKRRPLHGSISDSIYEITSKEIVRVEDFISAMQRVSDEYLRGSVILEVSGSACGITDISASITAEIIKLMLKSMKDGMLRISISVDSDMRITLTPSALPPTKEFSTIITFAKSAGYTVDRDEHSVTLTSKINVTQIFSIYAISCDDIYAEMKEILAQ